MERAPWRGEVLEVSSAAKGVERDTLKISAASCSPLPAILWAEKELSRRAGTALGIHFPYSPPQTKYRNLPRKVSGNRAFSLITKGLSQEEIDEMEKQKQIESIVPGLDEMIEVTYKEYKEKYSDCETIKNSFHRDFGRAYISIIVRNANIRRLVNEETL